MDEEQGKEVGEPRANAGGTRWPSTRLQRVCIGHIEDWGFYPKTNDKLKVVEQVLPGNLLLKMLGALPSSSAQWAQ